jgi:hypothetical protein
MTLGQSDVLVRSCAFDCVCLAAPTRERELDFRLRIALDTIPMVAGMGRVEQIPAATSGGNVRWLGTTHGRVRL